MEQDGQHRERVTGSVDKALPGPPLAAEGVLAGPGHADDHRVDRLEVGRVGGHGDRDGAARAAREAAGGALVVLDVAGALDRLGVEVPLELLEDLAVGLADDVGQDVEAAAVRHAHDRLVEPLGHRLVEEGVEDHDGRLGALEAEPLLAHVAGVEEALEDLGGVQPVQDVALLVRHGHRGDPLDVLLDPPFLAGVLDVHVLDPERAAVGVAEHREDLVEGGHALAGQSVGHEGPGQVPDGQSVVQRVQLGVESTGSASSGSRWAMR